MTNKLKLTEKQRRFVEFYCGECKFNATQASIKSGYSENTARQIGTENLAKPAIQEEITAFMNQATEIAEVTTEWVVKGLKKEAESDGKGSSHSARISAYWKLGEYTGGFDKNKQHNVHSGVIGVKDVTDMSEDDVDKEIEGLLDDD